MQTLQFQSFSKEALITDLEQKFPQYQIKKSWGSINVRTGGFTATGNVNLKINEKEGKITTRTNFDSAILFVLFCWPLGLYIYSKKAKQLAMETEVIEGLKEILNSAEILSSGLD